MHQYESMVKIGGKWITLEEYQRTRRSATEAVKGFAFLILLAVATFIAFWTWGGGV